MLGNIEKLFHLKSELGKLYIYLVILSFAISMVDIFIPVYLLKLGYSLSTVFLFLLIQWTTFGLFAPVYGKLISYLGLKEVIILRTPIMILVFLILSVLGEHPLWQQWFFVIPVLYGFAHSVHSLSIQSLFAHFRGDMKPATETGKFIAMPNIARILGPFVGCLIAVTLGFPILFTIVVGLIFVAMVPVWFIKTNLDHPPFHIRTFHQIRTDFKDFAYLVVNGIRSFSVFVIVPIAVYLYAENMLSLGIIMSIIALFKAVTYIISGRWADSHKAFAMMKVGAVGVAAMLLVFAFIHEYAVFAYLVVMIGFVEVLFTVPYETYLFTQSRHIGASCLEFITFKEFSLWMGRAVLFGVLIIVSRIDVAFYMGSAASMIFWLF